MACAVPTPIAVNLVVSDETLLAAADRQPDAPVAPGDQHYAAHESPPVVAAPGVGAPRDATYFGTRLNSRAMPPSVPSS